MVRTKPTLQDAVRGARCDLFLTQHELADRAKVSRDLIARIENGRQVEVTPRISRKLGKALGTDFKQWEKK